MADKMKEQQKKQQEEAQKEAKKRAAAAQKETKPANGTERRSTRASDKGNASKSDSKPTKLPTRGRPKSTTDNTISSYFSKAEVPVEENTTVQDALAKAADEYEAKPTALGEQELVATQQPALVTGGRMREYQLEGLEWLKTLWMNGLCGILADEMGLGKTIQAISLIAFFKEKKVSGPFLIAAPLSTVSNWVDEFARWTPDIKTVLYHGTKDERSEIRRKYMNMQHQRDMDFPVVCTSYEICMNDRKYLANYQWRYIVVVSVMGYPK
jgi:ATP-dependent DNA helicase